MTIYEIDQAIMNCIDETGEVIDLEQLMALQMDKEQKLENIACWIIDLKAEADAIKAQEAVLKGRREVTEKKAERLKMWLSDMLCGQPMKSDRVAVSFRKSTAVEIEAGAEIPEEYQVQKVTVTPDKKAIGDALKNGILIPGCWLAERNNMTVK